jgi:hypothetical protein
MGILLWSCDDGEEYRQLPSEVIACFDTSKSKTISLTDSILGKNESWQQEGYKGVKIRPYLGKNAITFGKTSYGDFVENRFYRNDSLGIDTSGNAVYSSFSINIRANSIGGANSCIDCFE